MSCKLFDLAAFGRSPLVITERIAPHYHDNASMMALGSRRKMRSAVLLDASGVLPAWSDWIDREFNRWPEQFVRVNPPWPNAFVYGGTSINSKGVPLEFGVHCRALSREQCEQKGIGDFTGPSSDAAWRVLADAWYRKSRELTARYDPPTCAIDIDADGKYLAHGLMEAGVSPQAFSESATFPLFVFQLLHCRNVSTVASVHRPLMPRGLRNKSPKVSYHKLSITTATTNRGDREPSGEHEEKAKHICRGNFAHYTEEKPLFGKHTGMFWRPMHIRGSAKHGIVGKEYTMALPSTEAPA